jgi:hypothetical protein
MWTFGAYYLELLKVTTTFTEFSSSCTGSFYDVITGKSGATLLPGSITDCMANPGWVNAYEDQYWNADILAALYPDIAEQSWYAARSWYGYIPLVGEYDPQAYAKWKMMVDDQIAGRRRPSGGEGGGGNGPPPL